MIVALNVCSFHRMNDLGVQASRKMSNESRAEIVEIHFCSSLLTNKVTDQSHFYKIKTIIPTFFEVKLQRQIRLVPSTR